MRQRLTKPHRDLVRLLRERPLLRKLRVEHRANGRKIDVAFPRVRVAIEMQGCFWHACADCYPKPSRLQRSKIRDDRRREADITGDGWVFMPVRECDFRRDPDAVVRSIEALVRVIVEAIGG